MALNPVPKPEARRKPRKRLTVSIPEKDLQAMAEAELSICASLREKGERTGKFPIEEYQRGYLNATDALDALKNISEAVLEERKI
mgnify:CR=1 FL=1